MLTLVSQVETRQKVNKDIKDMNAVNQLDDIDDYRTPHPVTEVRWGPTSWFMDGFSL